ncbi:MAG: hypothetical protein COS90_08635, partial [Deltaproteobacteria bacterium CG07_land_8_20_14_0_80_60_11]
KYWEIKCQNPAWPGDPDGFCILHSQDKEKNPDDFQAALQARWKQTDQESYDFRGVFFPGFFEPVEVFGSQEFNQPVDFSWATFTKGANFYGAAFTKRAHFFKATFTEGADFYGAAIGGPVVFWGINPRDEAGRAPSFIGIFSRLEFQDRGVLRFQDTSLARVRFEGADLRRPEFHHVTWGSIGGRQIIYDEASLRQEEKEKPWFWDWFWARLSGHLALIAFALEIGHTADTTGRDSIGAYLAEEPAPPEPPWGDKYGEVERLYRNLKLNYEAAGDYKNAGDFHYG